MIIFLVVVLVAIIQISYMMNTQYTTGETSEEIHFVIDQVEITPESTYSFHDAEGKPFTDYTFSLAKEIKPGDIIARKANSKEIRVYRVDPQGKKEVVMEVRMKDK